MANENITVGTMAIAKVGRNEIAVEVIARTDGGTYRVRNKVGREFTARRIAAMPKTEMPVKPLSLMKAEVEVLRRSEHPLNTREIVAQTALGLWTPTGAKTPEQTLYGTIFLEIATREHPRIVKSKQKGKFELNREV